MDEDAEIKGKVCELLNLQFQWRLARAEAELADANRVGGDRVHWDDKLGGVGGEVKAMIHPTHYHALGQRYGYDCWKDPSFVRDYQKWMPQSKIRSRSAKPRVGWRAPAFIQNTQAAMDRVSALPEPRNVRFAKTYEAPCKP